MISYGQALLISRPARLAAWERLRQGDDPKVCSRQSLWLGEIRVSVTPTMREIATAVAEAHGLTLDDLLGPSRGRRAAHPRQEAMWRCFEVRRPDGSRRYSKAQIGRFFGDRDHTTVGYGIRQHEARRAKAQALEGARA